MSGLKKRYYWDACIYIAWLKKEESKWLPAIAEIVRLNKQRSNLIVTSVMTMMEVLESRLTETEKREFKQCFDFGTHQMWDIDLPIVTVARRYRDHYLANPVNGKSLMIPDAFHLATATVHKVDAFHTFDKGKRGEGCSLLALSNNVAGDRLRVCRPELPPDPSGQASMFDIVHPENEEE